MTKNYLEQSQRTALDFGQSKSEPIFPDDSEKNHYQNLAGSNTKFSIKFKQDQKCLSVISMYDVKIAFTLFNKLRKVLKEWNTLYMKLNETGQKFESR